MLFIAEEVEPMGTAADTLVYVGIMEDPFYVERVMRVTYIVL